MTVRERVIPANPQTPAQVLQRDKFADALQTTRNVGPDVYQEDWNRSIGQLPGFQSWMSILLNNIDDSRVLATPPDTPLGDLHFPDTYNVITGSTTGTIQVDFSNELGPNGTLTDIFVGVAIQATKGASVDRVITNSGFLDTRNDLVFVFTGLIPNEPYIVAGYFRGQGAADGLLTVAHWDAATSNA